VLCSLGAGGVCVRVSNNLEFCDTMFVKTNYFEKCDSSWNIDHLRRRVTNKEFGVSLVEGRGQDGDLEFTLKDVSESTIVHFYAQQDYSDNSHNELAPDGTNYSVVVNAYNLYAFIDKKRIAINGHDVDIASVLNFLADALSMAAAMYELGFPKYVSVKFTDNWL
jgi:hypothetical protein